MLFESLHQICTKQPISCDNSPDYSYEHGSEVVRVKTPQKKRQSETDNYAFFLLIQIYTYAEAEVCLNDESGFDYAQQILNIIN